MKTAAIAAGALILGATLGGGLTWLTIRLIESTHDIDLWSTP